MFRHLAAALAAFAVAGCMSTPPVSDAARKELAPTGKLRAGMNLSNTLFTRKDPATGELRGVAVDIMRELASRVGVPLEMVVHPTPGDVADAVNKNTWDVAILAIEQSRAQTIAFSPPISEIEATYMVHKDSKLRTAAEADAAGVRIAAANKAGYELYLTRTLKSATLVRTKNFEESIDTFNARRADALAALKPILIDNMAKLPDARFVEGRFMTVNHGVSTPRTRSAAAEYLKAFAEDLNATGFIARSIERNGVQGLGAVK
jgi:polar amino acid transport system substrate-binding protein